MSFSSLLLPESPSLPLSASSSVACARRTRRWSTARVSLLLALAAGGPAQCTYLRVHHHPGGTNCGPPGLLPSQSAAGPAGSRRRAQSPSISTRRQILERPAEPCRLMSAAFMRARRCTSNRACASAIRHAMSLAAAAPLLARTSSARPLPVAGDRELADMVRCVRGGAGSPTHTKPTHLERGAPTPRQ